jgi:NDP-sugar pyrophosphorylase family protein
MTYVANLASVDIAILAGGLGTRLSSVLPDAPKVMAIVGGRPFLDLLLEGLMIQGAGRVVLCLGSRAQAVVDYLAGHSYPPLEIQTSIEPRPLGTAGALVYALSSFRSDPVLVINGDTWTDADLPEFLAAHAASGASASILCAQVSDPRRYGRVEIDDTSRITRFEEKAAGPPSAGWVNAGVYLLNRSVLAQLSRGGRQSLEHDVFEAQPAGSLHAHRSAAHFLDIGTPESLLQARAVLRAQAALKVKTEGLV